MNVPAKKKRRSKKVELVRYLPDGELPRKKEHAAQDKAGGTQDPKQQTVA